MPTALTSPVCTAYVVVYPQNKDEVMGVIQALMFLPKLFRYFGMFQTFIGFVGPIWPFLSRFWRRVPA